MNVLHKINVNFKIVFFTIPLVAFLSYSEKAKSAPYTIAYSSGESGNAEIYLTNTEAASKIRITNHAGGDGYPAWSPDGKRIAFYAKYDGVKTWSIHTMNSDGINRKRLTHAESKWDNSPVWSPDEKKLYFQESIKIPKKSGSRKFGS